MNSISSFSDKTRDDVSKSLSVNTLTKNKDCREATKSWNMRSSMLFEKSLMTTTDLSKLDKEDKGWLHRLDQVDRDLEHAEVGLEDFIADMQDMKDDLELILSPEKKPDGGGFSMRKTGFSEQSEKIDYSDVNHRLANEGKTKC
mmetsp:Transcript_25011/g.34472  ORF Transcript_25011/g.34472 Transcript_25011/m.34472 type:complete len:144 (-) Transcript_25011:96-527(-)|eukprot:CAMPEP_0196586212 /NCGR_PEP_ID=MMETSP1081-20130531/53500_1 /TAXON_ID=36882 /ORGANISM="Pyramimonas amylifera, Strain CCMP720" /LENGTH=143 /DNA_ID=CAMNT_0041908011 /DNA_START=137 /DNA_END=568 /DNA_ORIENTATION=-